MRRYNLYVNWYPRGDIEGAVNADNLTYANYGTASSPYLYVCPTFCWSLCCSSCVLTTDVQIGTAGGSVISIGHVVRVYSALNITPRVPIHIEVVSPHHL